MEDYDKYPSIKYISENPGVLDKKVKVFEKLDGANCQFKMNSKGKLVAGSRAKPINNVASETAFSWKGDFLQWVNKEIRAEIYENFAKRGYNAQPSIHSALDPRYVFYGEWLSTHTKTYPKKFQDKFYLIDVLDKEKGEGGKFLDYDEAKKVVDFYGLDLNTVEVLEEGKMSLDDVKDMLDDSNYGVEKKEGLVMKNYSGSNYKEQVENFAKYVDPEFAEMRDKIDYHDSIVIERHAEDYIEKNYEELREMVAKSGLSNSDEPENLVDKIVEEVSGRGILHGCFDSSKVDMDLYKNRMDQALRVRALEMEGLL